MVVKKAAADLDLGTVRAFVAITEDRYFSEAAARLGISQQAISKRVAKLESDLGLRLFFRSRNGADLTEDGRAFLPHARALVGIADQALEVLRGRRCALRVDVLDTRLASIDLIRAFHQAIEDVDIDIITSDGFRSARAALARGSIDVAFGRVSGTLEEELRCVPAYLEPVHLLLGRHHPLAGRQQVEMGRLSGSTVWMPGNAAGSEWAEYYRFLGAAFDIQIDASGPNFGYEHFVQEIGSGERVGFVGERTRVPWHPGTVQVPLVDPTPMYPWSLLRHHQNQHPALGLLTHYVASNYRPFNPQHQWLPEPDRAAFTADPGLEQQPIGQWR
ncbi:DNA-binding transcriptional LysR family regulator [Streptosporangium album]|uniref:DNA-binding transcriptional LysR family regulator n=1 Tax=Streptosporangium album TaxID=47479 RepID=A0A7W7WCB8_9ACTN|nr:LysR family transcriptional regulator [Streptosporangium album]MBB4941926.1 DNA-binding transcriptional LysR family regulator [Streptosporangium album]